MTTPTGTITLLDVQNEFGGATPIAISEYYGGGGYVPAGIGVPSSGTISMNDLRGKSATTYGTLTFSLSTLNEANTGTFTLSGGSGIPDGTYYWRLEGTGITSGDFSSLTGSFTITSNFGQFNVTAISDNVVEGTESFRAVVGTSSGVPTPAVYSNYFNLAEVQTCEISASSTTNEGVVYNFTFVTFNYANGAPLYWDLSFGPGVSSADFTTATSGQLYVSASGANGSASGSFTLSADATTEGSEYFYIRCFSGYSSGYPQVVSYQVYINDTSVPASYSPGVSTSSLNEGSAVTVSMVTTGVPIYTTLYWNAISYSGGMNVSADLTPYLGSFVLMPGGAGVGVGSVDITAIADSLTEGSEQFYVEFRTGSNSGQFVSNTGVITVNDTSTTPPPPTYSASWSPAAINEGQSSTYTVTTTNVPDGTTLYLTDQGGTASAASDTTFGGSSGSFTIYGNTASFTIWALYDASEGYEFLPIAVRTGSTGGPVVTGSTLGIYDALGSVGSASLGSSLVYVGTWYANDVCQITSIAAYPVTRYFSFYYSTDGVNYSQVNLSNTTLTVAANATSSDSVVVYFGPNTYYGGLYMKLTCYGHNDYVWYQNPVYA